MKEAPTSLLHAQLHRSQTATPLTVRLDHAVEDAISDLGRINYRMIWIPQPKSGPSELTLRQIEAVCSRLLQAVEAYRIGNAS